MCPILPWLTVVYRPMSLVQDLLKRDCPCKMLPNDKALIKLIKSRYKNQSSYCPFVMNFES